MTNNYRKPNNCPYCGYFCDAAEMLEDKNAIPYPGDLSFCFMCSEAMQFDENMNLIKFDLNSIDDIVERNRLKMLQVKMRRFWDECPSIPEKEKKRHDSFMSKIDGSK